MFPAYLSVLIVSYYDFMKMSKENNIFLDLPYKQEMWFIQETRLLKTLSQDTSIRLNKLTAV